jgi:cytohesin
MLHDFDQQTFDQALRAYLWSFRLPGESQKIDRMMETFAIRFCECNPGLFHHTDGGYVLAFATIMLNTSLHNPSVAHKPSLQEFVSMNRGIDDGHDVPRELLEELYHSIAASPFKIPDDDDGLSLLFFNPEKEGYLRKEGEAARHEVGSLPA